MSLLKSCNGSSEDPAVDLTQGLVAHYLLNNNADDSHGTYDGTAVGGVDFQGDMVVFDGVDDYFDSNINKAINLECISFWSYAYQDVIPSQTYKILGTINQDTTSGTNWMATGEITGVATNETFSIYFDNNSIGTFVYITDIIPKGFFNIIIQWEVDKYVIYLNGTACINYYINSIPKLSLDLVFGKRFLPQYHTSKTSNLRVYNEAKDQAFITALYEEGYYPKPLPLPTTVGLVAHYPLTGTAEDTTGNYNGTENGGLTYVDDAEFGSVASFDGVNDYIDCNINNAIYHDCVSLWFYSANAITSTSTFNCLGQLSSQGSYPTYNILATGNSASLMSDETLTMWIFGGYTTSTYYSYIKSNIPAGWNNIVIQWEINRYEYYLNGLKLTSYTAGMGYVKQTLDIKLGRRDYPTYGTGQYSNLRVYNRALTQQEITDIYNYEKNFRPIDIDDGLVAYYPLANNSMDNYKNQYDGIDSVGVTYDGDKATIPNGDTVTFPTATGFVEAYYTINGVVTKTTIESTLSTLTNCTLAEVRKYSKALSIEQQTLIGYII